MKCPVCTTADLLMTDRQGIEIDYCPQCRGVWLDRGELDKIIERSATATAATPAQTQPQPRDDYRRDERHHDPRYHDPRHHDPRYGHKKRKSFLGDLFDFD